jgi:hypothetical protein
LGNVSENGLLENTKENERAILKHTLMGLILRKEGGSSWLKIVPNGELGDSGA